MKRDRSIDITGITSTTEWIQALFFQKKTANPSFSIRAFARQTGVSPARLSQFLSGKRMLSWGALEKVIQRECYSHAEVEHIRNLHNSEKRIRKCRLGGRDSGPLVSNRSHERMTADAFHLVADWYHFAILNLVKLDEHKLESDNWIAETLQITRQQAQDAKNRLLRLGYLKFSEGVWSRIEKPLLADFGCSDYALKQSHAQSISQAKEALFNVNLKLRNISSVTFPADPKNVQIVAEEIENFLVRVSERMGCGRKSAVYNLNVQLVPVSKIEEK